MSIKVSEDPAPLIGLKVNPGRKVSLDEARTRLGLK